VKNKAKRAGSVHQVVDHFSHKSRQDPRLRPQYEKKKKKKSAYSFFA
jgi:hypothetical protein